MSKVSQLFVPSKPSKMTTYSVRLSPEQVAAIESLRSSVGCRGVASLLLLAVGFAAEKRSAFVKFCAEVNKAEVPVE